LRLQPSREEAFDVFRDDVHFNIHALARRFLRQRNAVARVRDERNRESRVNALSDSQARTVNRDE